jgi:pimeloyl-ACP methyl ester carboxylesterase
MVVNTASDAFRRWQYLVTGRDLPVSESSSAFAMPTIWGRYRLLLASGTMPNLYGTSYGPRAILAAMRETPQHIRSVVLDSPMALQANSGIDQAPDLQRSLREVFDACAADAKCHAAYPRFEDQYWVDIKRANERPIDVEIRDAEGKPLAIKISGNTLLSGTFLALYDTSVIRVLPFATDAIANGNNGVVALLAQELTLAFPGWADGMGTSVQCNEEIPFYTAELMRGANKGVRQEIIDAEVGTSTQAALDDALALCRAWGTPKPRPQENQAVVSGIPALVLDGQFDPIAPPNYGKLAAEKLSRSYVFEFRSSGHGVTYQQYDCATGMITQFLAQPTSRPDSGCLASIKPLDFVIGEAPQPAPTEPPVAVTPAVRPPSGISAPDTGTGNASASRDLDAGWAFGLMMAGVLLVVFGAANVVRSARAGSRRRS